MFKRFLFASLTVSVLAGCVEDNATPRGLRLASPTQGPTIKFDLNARPFPEIPFPNDLATLTDPGTSTGKRLNVSLVGGSKQEEKVRYFIDKLAGFGVFSPISVPFDAPLDLANIRERHQQKVPDFRDDAVFLVNVDPKSPHFGEFELLDLGLGNYPILHAEPDRFYDFDPRQKGTNLLFESVGEEDTNGNGVLDPIEDTDDDGVWDVPNLFDVDGDPYEPGNTLEWYERETNTLILRPVHVLEPNTRYAVVITDALVGEDKNAINSPFSFVNHARQTTDLEPLRTVLPKALPNRFTDQLESVRFAWTFTTTDPMEDLRGVRAGLYGEGPLKRLSSEFPPDLAFIHNGKSADAELPMAFDLEPLRNFLVPLLPSMFGVASGSADIIAENLDFIDYMVSGTFRSPYFLADKDGLADETISRDRNPQDDDEIMVVDPRTGEAFYKEGEVTFLCSVPKETDTIKPPFPTVIYSHAINSTRLEIILFGGALAKFGFATCAIDAVGHGVVIPPEYDELIKRGVTNLKIPNFPDMIGHHRARDLNNDGVAESGGMFFTSDILHTRDNFRQTAVDQMQFVRILRSFDGAKRFPAAIDESDPYVQARREIVSPYDNDGDGQPEIMGDFNADGVVDFGGDQAFVAFGTSLGGIQTTLISASEPVIKAAVSNAGGGGMIDISYRTTIRNARDGVTLRMLGPLVMGRVLDDGTELGNAQLYFTLPTADRSEKVEIGIVPGFAEGDRIVYRNPLRELRTVVPEDERQTTVYVRNGVFRAGVAADADGATTRRAKLQFDAKISLVGDLMGCPTKGRCGDNACPGGHTCDAANQCQPVLACVQSFDPASASYEDDPQTQDIDESVVYAEELRRRTVEDARAFGDPLIIEVWSADGELKQTIDRFPENTVFENILYPKGTPLAALAQGLGLKRQTPQFRKFSGIAQMLIEGADPAVVSPTFFLRPQSFPYESAPFDRGDVNFMMAGTVGDQTVPISAGIAIARTAGIVNTFDRDPRYGKTENQYLIDNFVYEGIHWLDRFPDFPDTLFDADDLDNGTFEDPDREAVPPNADAAKPVRSTIETPYGISALRLPYLRTRGEHTFNAPLTGTVFDATTFMTNQVGWYLVHRGQVLSDDACLEDNLLTECSFYDADTFAPPDLFRCSTGGCLKNLE